MAGKAEAVADIMGGVVQRLGRCETGAPDEDEAEEFPHRNTRELLYRLRKQVPSVRSTPRRSARRSMGTDIFS